MIGRKNASRSRSLAPVAVEATTVSGIEANNGNTLQRELTLNEMIGLVRKLNLARSRRDLIPPSSKILIIAPVKSEINVIVPINCSNGASKTIKT